MFIDKRGCFVHFIKKEIGLMTHEQITQCDTQQDSSLELEHTETSRPLTEKQARELRIAQALRNNLRRRKQAGDGQLSDS